MLPILASDMGVIDEFVATFSTYIDSGFGLLDAEVAYLTTFIVTIDIVLAGLYWALSPNSDVIASLLKKILYIGVFALIINQFAFLSGVVFDSFAGLGLTATGSKLSAADLLRPGFIASQGFDAGQPILEEIGNLTGPVAFFVNIVTICVLALAWIITLFAFFFIAIQIFVTIIEFKLTTLAGFVLIPFALWNRTSFLAERVLGNVVASGIKLMVLAIIVGVGSSLFGEITAGFEGDVDVRDGCSVILGSLAMFALALFGPGIATGLVSGAPQLGAGAAVGTAAAVGGGALAGAAAIKSGGASLAAGTADAAKAGAALGGGAGMAFRMGKMASGKGGAAGAAAGLGAVAQAGAGAVANKAKAKVGTAASTLRAHGQGGARGGVTAIGGSIKGGSSTPAAENDGGERGEPKWVKRAAAGRRRDQATMAAGHAVRSGDRGGVSEGPSLKQQDKED